MILLSYPLSPTTPAYGGGKRPQFEQVRSLEKGDSCNMLELLLTNHSGTHIDMPAHFIKSGPTVTQAPLDFWFTTNVGVMDLKRCPAPGQLLGSEDLPLASISADCEALLLKTGWGGHRGENVYWQNPPGFQPELAADLRQQCPRLRFFGFDLISLSSFVNREEGRRAHRAFLGGDQPIHPIEDMDLSALPAPIHSLLVSPFFLEGGDGAPVTVWANL
ncbi:MAG: cyclase family protein [Deltaproteobacteria bacterium]|nr:cyclase family protein [Deltaproteobacteria bacterium]MBI3294161.1 cyclase family protein [Deltaproteobacteria bacterium]